ncbi:MAG: DUF839 domain-containing protein [Pseudanabaenaceae cyanobacterium SKYGB_i_bin29]|nr:DUF839 domain-containing protein [Pseudanabaenaceae cyanobacterium SKYG29]MDW8421927.1 DUF839 domain-containing protein [Pseudanabaenaceae cyanobacterium SKYGB_i_bin29]
MSDLSRRQLLAFFGVGVGTAVLSDVVGEQFLGASAQSVSGLKLTPVRLPSPLPIYRTTPSFLPTGFGGQGRTIEPSSDGRLDSYTVLDDVTVPPEFEYYTILTWGDRVFPNPEEYWGFNADFNGYIPINGNVDGWLVTNHEYIGYPFHPLAPATSADLNSPEFPDAFEPVVGFRLPRAASLSALPREDQLLIQGEFCYNQGFSVVRIRRNASGRFEPVNDPKNRRYHLLSGLAINAERTDQYRTVTSWGPRSYQKGDNNFLIGTGPAVRDVFEGVNADGLGNRIIGTGFNCSGGVTPWGTVLSCEENFQAGTPFFNGVQEDVRPNGTQVGYLNLTPNPATGTLFGLVGEKYGWVVEVDPNDPNFRARKHTALGRFRWENITVRAEAGKRLVTYMGCDRRGGRVYKFVSRGTVTNPTDKANSRLLEDGTLFTARFEPNGTGRWIPLTLDTPTDPIRPSELSAVPFASGLFSETATLNLGRTRLPRRAGIAGQTVDGGSFICERGASEEAAFVTGPTGYLGKRLRDFYPTLGAILVDAHLAGNLAGGTPTARPEDLEINPRNPREIFIAFTDCAPGSDGYPDSRIFNVAKLSEDPRAQQQSGALFKIIEDSEDGTGLTFRWERFQQGGEAGSYAGAGFANVDNLAFDDQGNIWGVTDMSTPTHNGFATGATRRENTINHNAVGDVSAFTGVFGNNFFFYIPVSGPNAGQLVPFGYGPPRSECTGPFFVGDTFILSVQHPGEDEPYSPPVTYTRTIPMLDLNGVVFNQTRTVTRGSTWPRKGGNVPRPAVIGIRRKNSTNPNGSFLG